MPLTSQELRLLKKFGAQVRRHRVSAGLTQEKLAELCVLNPRTVQKIEAGQLNILLTTISRLCDALECEASDLL